MTRIRSRTRRLLAARRRPALRRGAWGVLDQVLSSLGNFALGLLVVRNVDIASFGVYSLLFVTYLLFLGTIRTLLSQPFTIRLPEHRDTATPDQAAVLAGTLVVALAGSAAVVCFALITGGDSTRSLAAFAVVLPGLLMQDAYRLTFFALGRPRDAAVNDFVWTALMLLGAGTVVLMGFANVATLVLCWGGGASVAAVVGWMQCHVRPRLRGAWPYFRRNRDLGIPLTGDFWAQQGALQASTYGMGLIASVTVVGVFRGAAFLMGPLNLITNALAVVALPELARLRHTSLRAVTRTVTGLSALPALAAVLAGTIFVMVPDTWGTALMGPIWQRLDGVVVPFALARAAGGAAWGAIIGCRALEAATGMLRTRLIASPVSIILTLAGAAVAEARGAAIGMAVGETVGLVLWWLQYWRATEQWADSSTTAEIAASTARSSRA